MSNSIKFFIISLFSFLVTGCSGDDIDIAADERIQFEGNVALENSGISVFSMATESYNTSMRNANVLGKGKVDHDGLFSFPSLKAEDKGMSIFINPIFAREFDSTYNSVVIHLSEEIQDHYLELPVYNLGKAANPKIEFRNNSGIDTLTYEIVYLPAFSEVILAENSYQNAQSIYNRAIFLSGNITAEEGYIENSIQTKLGSVVQLFYTKDEEEFEASFQVDDLNMTYVIEY